jgi:hypothetical protein
MNLTPENQARIIIENTKEEKQEYEKKSNGCHGSGTINITKEELKALQDGKCIALNDDEYSTFITLS